MSGIQGWFVLNLLSGFLDGVLHLMSDISRWRPSPNVGYFKMASLAFVVGGIFLKLYIDNKFKN